MVPHYHSFFIHGRPPSEDKVTYGYVLGQYNYYLSLSSFLLCCALCVTVIAYLSTFMKILKSDRLTLRPVSLGDAPVFIRWFQDRDVTQFLVHYQLGKKAPTLAEERGWIRSVMKNKYEPVWCIVTKEANIIGNTTLRITPESKIANFGIVIGDKTEWGKGYAGEVLNILLKYAFTTLKMNRFELTVDAANTRAVTAYKKAGFVMEGCMRQHLYNKRTKKFGDVYMMSVLREEWEKRK